MKGFNLALAFLLELVLLVALGFWGFHLGQSNVVHWTIGLLAPLVLAIAWGWIAAPEAKYRLEPTQLLIFKIAVFTIGAAALYATGQKRLAVIFEAVSLISLALAFAWKQ